MEEILAQIRQFGLIPVVAIDDSQDAQPLGEALIQGGLPCAEITFRTAAAEETIRVLTAKFPEMLVGAGTVLSTSQAEQAVGAGARFIVSPGLDPQVVAWCLERGVAVTPGVATPTEINQAINFGLSTLKFFPAEALGGPQMLKAIAAPFTTIRFIPTGGINAENLAGYLALPVVHACGGSWIVKKDLIAGGDFATISRLVKEALMIVEKVRGEGVGS
jgi:2-dehydro-3-deoxyphosphogluconate aldolase/(4S)-4-hydroxy-2-oxoglutarate aldolase